MTFEGVTASPFTVTVNELAAGLGAESVSSNGRVIESPLLATDGAGDPNRAGGRVSTVEPFAVTAWKVMFATSFPATS